MGIGGDAAADARSVGGKVRRGDGNRRGKERGANVRPRERKRLRGCGRTHGNRAGQRDQERETGFEVRGVFLQTRG